MKRHSLDNRSMRWAARVEFPVLKTDKLWDEQLFIINQLDPIPKLGDMRLIYLLPTIGTDKAEIHLDEADVVAMIE